MNNKQFLEEQLKERFKVSSVIGRLKTKIKGELERGVFEKYKDERIYENGMWFKLLGVRVDFYLFGELHTKDVAVSIYLAYTCVSDLPKNKKERLSKVIKAYGKEKQMEPCNFKVPLWKENLYMSNLEEVLDNKLTLKIS